jgi:hypothetical protein
MKTLSDRQMCGPILSCLCFIGMSPMPSAKRIKQDVPFETISFAGNGSNSRMRTLTGEPNLKRRRKNIA